MAVMYICLKNTKKRKVSFVRYVRYLVKISYMGLRGIVYELNEQILSCL